MVASSASPALLLPLLLLASAAGVGANYVIFSQRFSADPAPIVHNGRVYLYTSHDKDHNHGFDMSDYNCLSSSDMVNWRDEGIVFSMANTTWAEGLHAWAQQVVELKNGTFVMFFPAVGNGGGVGVASATSPAGPFRQVSGGFCTAGSYWCSVAAQSALPFCLGAHLTCPWTGGCGMAGERGLPSGHRQGVNECSIFTAFPCVFHLPSKAWAFLRQADDPTIFIDHNGEGILCANGNKGCPSQPDGGCPDCGVLAADMISWKTPPAVLNSFDKSSWHYFEAPWLLRRNDTYYMSYMMEYSTCPGNHGQRRSDLNCSWSHGGFDIGYSVAAAASAASPLAAAWQPKGTLMFSTDWDEQGGNNHQGIVEFPVGSDNWYLFYHSAWLSGNGLRRNVGVDRLYFNDSDPANPMMLPVLATPNWLRAAVQHLSPYAAAVPAFTMAQASTGVITRASNDVGAESVAELAGDGAQSRCVDGIKDGAWTHTRQVDFGGSIPGALSESAGLSLSLRVNVPACSVGGCPHLTVHLDMLETAAVVNCVLNSTRGWATVSCPVTGPLRGVHDVFFLFEGAECVTTLLTFSWWKLSRASSQHARGLAPPTPTAPAKAAVQLTMWACAPHRCTWKAPAVSNLTGVPVGVVALGMAGSVLAAKAGLTAARLVLHDNEDGTWGIRVGDVRACATPQPAGAGGAVLALVVAQPGWRGSDAPCARFRVQVMTGGVYALRSAAIGLWVVVGPDGVLQVQVVDPRSTPATAFTFMTTLGLPPH